MWEMFAFLSGTRTLNSLYQILSNNLTEIVAWAWISFKY